MQAWSSSVQGIPQALSQGLLVPSPLHGWEYAHGIHVLLFWVSLASLLCDADRFHLSSGEAYHTWVACPPLLRFALCK